MPDREEIINNLEHEVNKAHGEGWDFVDLSTDDAKKILVLLKAQEPRVMTLDEVHEMSWDYCCLEEEVIKDKVLQIHSGKYRIKCITWPSIASCTLTFGDEAYGKRWRCWTSRPTDEQREKVKWDDTN